MEHLQSESMLCFLCSFLLLPPPSLLFIDTSSLRRNSWKIWRTSGNQDSESKETAKHGIRVWLLTGSCFLPLDPHDSFHSSLVCCWFIYSEMATKFQSWSVYFWKRFNDSTYDSICLSLFPPPAFLPFPHDFFHVLFIPDRVIDYPNDIFFSWNMRVEENCLISSSQRKMHERTLDCF